MQLRALSESLHTRGNGITFDLLHCILPLLLSLGHRCAILMESVLFRFLPFLLGENLQLQNVAVFGSIVCEVREEEEIAIAVVKSSSGAV